MHRFPVLASVLCPLIVCLLAAGSDPTQATAAPGTGARGAAADPHAFVGPRRSVIVRLAQQADVSGAHRVAGKEARTRYVLRQLRDTAHATQGPLVDWLRARGAAVSPLFIVNALVVEAHDHLLAELAARPDVASVRPTNIVTLYDTPPLLPQAVQAPQAAEPGIRDIGADRVWRLGHQGRDIVVAVLDTGSAYKHPAIKNAYRGLDSGHDYSWMDKAGEEAEPVDENGHGTHVTGTVVGKAGARMIGVAPEARWIACRVIRDRVGSDAAALACLQWALAPTALDGSDPRPDLAPDIVNASWGGEVKKDCDGTPELHAAVANLQAAGILFVASAGNAGSDCGTICAPGRYPEAFTVANYDTRSRRIADSSSRGPVGIDDEQLVKPDVAAPGVGINSSLPPARYGALSGTSMAAPHVSGAAALLLGARPELRGRPEVVRAILADTARSLRGDRCGPDADEGPNNSAGYGVIDVEAAVVAALTATPPPPRTATATRSATATGTARPTRTPTPAVTGTQRPTRTPTPGATPSGPDEAPGFRRAYLPGLFR